MTKEIKEDIILSDFILMLKEKQSIKNIKILDFLLSISSTIIKSQIIYDLVGNKKYYRKAYFVYGPIKHYEINWHNIPDYHTIEFVFSPCPDQRLHLRCIYKLEMSYNKNVGFKHSLNYLKTAQLKYIEGIGNMDFEINREPFLKSKEISLVNFKDWISFDFNQIIWLRPGPIVGEFSAFENYSYYFKLPIRDVFSNLNLFDTKTIFKDFDNRNYAKRIWELSSFSAKIKRNRILFFSDYHYYKGDNPKNDSVSFELPLSKMYEIIDENKKNFN